MACMVQEIQAAVELELKTLKQMLHIQDLIKVSNIDELTTRVDEYKTKAQSARDQENVLQFCLNTAERHLEASDPAVAAKIAESRKARLARVSGDLKKQLAELEQRAKKTSLMNSSRLKEMIPEAKRKHDAAATHRAELLVKLRELAATSTVPQAAPATDGKVPQCETGNTQPSAPQAPQGEVKVPTREAR